MNNRNKRGQMTIFLVIIVVALIFFLILIFVGGVIVVRANTALDQDVQIGQVNFHNVTSETWGKFTTMYLNNADWWGISVIMGMILGLFISAYITRNSFPKYGIIIDIFIIIAIFFVSLYISRSYNMLLDSLATAGETFLEDYTPRTSTFLLNLPIFSVIIGVIMMVIFHSSIPRKQEEQIYQSGGYLQGAY